MIKLRTQLWFLFLAVPTASLATPADLVEVRNFDGQPDDTLIIENDYGRVRVSTWNNSSIEVVIRKIAQDADALENIYVVSHRSGSKVFIRSYFYDYRSESLYLEIKAPPRVNLIIWGVNPAVDVQGVAGKVRVQTLTGVITAANLLSSSSLATEEGNIHYSSSVQPLQDIRLESIRGTVNCRLSERLNLRSWLRAGKTLSWNDDLVLSPGSLEKQIGIGGPLLLAASPEGNVSVRLDKEEDPTPSGGMPTNPKKLSYRPSGSSESVSSADGGQFPAGPDRQKPGLGADLEKTSPELVPASYSTADEPKGAASGGFSVKVNVDWVLVNASVRDRYTNRAVPDLLREDFELYEDRTLQPVEKFESTEAPFNLLLLLDVSGSTKSFINMVKEASVQFTREIKTNDGVAVATFNSSTHLTHDFTNDRDRIQRAIKGIRSGGGTAFYDALDQSLNEYMESVDGRKAIVVFTDGVDNQLTGDYGSGSQTTFKDLYREIQEADTLIYTIFLDTEADSGNRGRPKAGGLGGILTDIILGRPIPGTLPGGWGRDPAYMEARRELERIAEQTGGRMYAPNNIHDLANVYSEIANDLRIQYTLGYHSQNTRRDGLWREIRVKIKNRSDLAVRARKGYYEGQD